MRTGSFVLAAFLAAQAACASTVSYTGTLASPEDSTTQITVTMATAGTLGLQTWGFGGGTNAADEVIPAGGFDPFVGVFSGTGDGAVFIDGASDILGSYGAGCPPAGTVTIGKGALCGDITLSESLAAGTYTVLLTDADYLPAAVFESGGLLGDGFIDFTGGAFQTCNVVGSDTTCITPTADWALDITTPNSTPPPVPEPAGLWLFGIPLIAWGAASQRRLVAVKRSTFTFKV
jgi:hypothetical protein